MSTLANRAKHILAAIALIGAGLAWFFVGRVEKRVSQLERRHPSLDGEGEVTLNVTQVQEAEDGASAEVSPATVFERLTVLGFTSEVVVMDNQPNGKNQATKTFTVEIPRNTTHVIPTIQGFASAFGRITDHADGTFRFQVNDHHLGLEVKHIAVTAIEDTTATLEATMLLRDINGDD